MAITAKIVRNFILAPMLASAIMAQSGDTCDSSIKNAAVNSCTSACADIGECIFGCEIGGINNVDTCAVSCTGLGSPCLDSCLSTVSAITAGCTQTSNVTSSMGLKLGTVVYNRATGVWQQTVVLTNTSSATLSNMGFVLDSLAAGWTMMNPDGATSALIPLNSPYKNFVSLAPGASAMLTLQFGRAGVAAYTYSPRVLSGTAR